MGRLEACGRRRRQNQLLEQLLGNDVEILRHAIRSARSTARYTDCGLQTVAKQLFCLLNRFLYRLLFISYYLYLALL